MAPQIQGSPVCRRTMNFPLSQNFFITSNCSSKSMEAELSTVAPALAQRVSSLGTRLPAYRMRSARSSIWRPRTETRSGSPGPAPTISMWPWRTVLMSRAAATVQFSPFFLGTSSRELFALSKAAASLTLGVPMCFMTVLLGWGTSISTSSSAVQKQTGNFFWSAFTTGSSLLALIVEMEAMLWGMMPYSFSVFIISFSTFRTGPASRARPMPRCTTQGTQHIIGISGKLGTWGDTHRISLKREGLMSCTRQNTST